MTFKSRFLMWAALACGAATILAAAPDASASSGYSCNTAGAGTVCQSPGNVQLNDAPSPARFYPYGGEGYLMNGGGGSTVGHSGGGGSHGGHR
ncbi:MAG: hypothetical protein WCE30_06655 [Mycobacterium sp.]